MLTDIPGQASVTILKALTYDSPDSNLSVSGASVIIYDNLGNEFSLNENKPGIYTHPSLVAEKGNAYHLKITTKDGETYQSDEQTLPKKYTQDSIYAEELEKTIYVTNSYNEYVPSTVKGIETYVDISGEDVELPKVYYDIRVSVMYSYPVLDANPPKSIFVWRTFNPNTNFNITSSKFEKSVGEIKKHSIGFFSTNIKSYDTEDSRGLIGFWVTVNKYNLNKPAYEYYLDIYDQLSAQGRLFDPTPSQINGNLRCTSNPDKKVFGFFEISSAEKRYYRYKGAKPVYKDQMPGFTPFGEAERPPAFFTY